MLSADHPTLVHRLQAHASAQPERPALTFLASGETPGPGYTYGQLWAAVASIAAQIGELGLVRGDRALLTYPPGLDFVVAFMGCLTAGVVPVPTALPRHGRTMQRMIDIGQDAGASAVLTTRNHLPALQAGAAAAAPRWLGTDGHHVNHDPVTLPLPEDLAFLQYTSGSTGSPKGVQVTHANLMANLGALRVALESDGDSVFLSWLPLFHDMGLIGVALHALHAGAHAILMSPLAFIQKPLRWPKAMSRYKATITGGPNFAFDLCARKATPDAITEFDLKSLTALFTGAEPIHADTLDLFTAAFEPTGFERRMFFPCYGLAEATLFVSGAPLDAPPSLVASDDRPIVGCGHVAEGHEVRIVDPATCEPVPDGTVGEIWFRGPSVATGYYGQPEASEAVFGGRIGDQTGYLRTGDLGFMRGPELFVSGRIKDMIIVEGRNHYPQDLELTVEGAHVAIRAATAIAFSVPRELREAIVIVAELTRDAGPTDEAALREAIREAIATGHDLAIEELVLLRTASVPKTTSGKVMRQACRDAYLAGEYAGEKTLV